MDSFIALNESGLMAAGLIATGLFAILSARAWWQVRQGFLILCWGAATFWSLADRASIGISVLAAATLVSGLIGAIALRDLKRES